MKLFPSIVFIYFLITVAEPHTTRYGNNSKYTPPCAASFAPIPPHYGVAGEVVPDITVYEADQIGQVIYNVNWTDGGIGKSIPTGPDFDTYFEFEEMETNRWNCKIKKQFTGLPDYPTLRDKIVAKTTFTGFPDYDQCYYTLTINLGDNNTQPPEFQGDPYTVQIAEDALVSYVIEDLQVEIRDQDRTDPNNIVQVSVDEECPLAPNPAEYKDFTGNFKHVTFELAKPLDYETQTSYTCNVLLQDSGTPQLESPSTIKIEVTPVQDEPPAFTSILYFAVLDSPEPEEGGTPLHPQQGEIEAKDQDQGDPLPVKYSMRDGDPEIAGTKYFKIDETTGVVSLEAVLDDDILENNWLNFILTAKEDGGDDSAESILQVDLPPVPTTTPQPTTTPITPGPDPSLQFTEEIFSAEIFNYFTVVMTLEVEVEGIGREEVTFTLEGEGAECFQIESPSGVIKTNGVEPPESGVIYTLTATARADPPSGEIEDTALVSITVLSSAGNAALPVSLYTASLIENQKHKTLFSFTAKNSQFVCISNVDPQIYEDHFGVEKIHGQESDWKVKQKGETSIYSEEKQEIRFRLQAFPTQTDPCPHKTTPELLRNEALVIISIEDDDNNNPVFIIPEKTSEFIAYPKDVGFQKVVGPFITLKNEPTSENEDEKSVPFKVLEDV